MTTTSDHYLTAFQRHLARNLTPAYKSRVYPCIYFLIVKNAHKNKGIPVDI
jgi:hypothetical protein